MLRGRLWPNRIEGSLDDFGETNRFAGDLKPVRHNSRDIQQVVDQLALRARTVFDNLNRVTDLIGRNALG